MELTSGLRLRSQVCDTEVIVVRAPTSPIELTCGGSAMIALDGEAAPGLSMASGLDTGNLLGKRYVAAGDDGLEILVTRAGAGMLADGVTPLGVKAAKPLPSSD